MVGRGLELQCEDNSQRCRILILLRITYPGGYSTRSSTTKDGLWTRHFDSMDTTAMANFISRVSQKIEQTGSLLPELVVVVWVDKSHVADTYLLLRYSTLPSCCKLTRLCQASIRSCIDYLLAPAFLERCGSMISASN